MHGIKTIFMQVSLDAGWLPNAMGSGRVPNALHEFDFRPKLHSLLVGFESC